MRPASTSRAHRDKGEAFAAILDAVDQVGSLRGAQSLRHLAESAEDVDALLDVARMEAMALRELPGLADALEDLAGHEDTLARLGELAELADEIDHLARAIVSFRQACVNLPGRSGTC